MQPDVKARFDALEVKRHAMIERVRALSDEKQTAKPKPKEFSPVDVLMHMALAEEVDVEMMDERPPLELRGKKPKTSFMYRFAVGSMRKAKRMPTMAKMIPRPRMRLEDAERKWAEVRKRIQGHLETMEGLHYPACKHPFFGVMSGADLLELLDAHQHYHDARFPVV